MSILRDKHARAIAGTVLFLALIIVFDRHRVLDLILCSIGGVILGWQIMDWALCTLRDS